MGRKSALSPDQWIEIERRIVVDGESVYALAKEFGVNESTVRRKIKPNFADKTEVAQKHHADLRAIAIEKARIDKESRTISDKIAELPYAKQVIVHDLSRRLANISNSLASAAELGAATAHRLSALANSEVAKVDDAEPLASVENLKGVAALTKLANESATIALNLLSANKDRIKEVEDMERTKAIPSGLDHFYGQ